MTENELERKFADFLVHEKGFSRDSLAWEVALSSEGGGQAYRVDLAAIDPLRNEFLALFEVKAKREPRLLREAVVQLAQYKRVLQKPQVPAYLVFPPIETSRLDFEISEVLENADTKEVYLSEFPTYAGLVSSDKAAEKVSQDKKIRSTVDEFKLMCFALAGVVTVLFLLDASDTFSITTQQLTLGGIAVFLLLLPYAAKFKMLGVEFERYGASERGQGEP